GGAAGRLEIVHAGQLTELVHFLRQGVEHGTKLYLRHSGEGTDVLDLRQRDGSLVRTARRAHRGQLPHRLRRRLLCLLQDFLILAARRGDQITGVLLSLRYAAVRCLLCLAQQPDGVDADLDVRLALVGRHSAANPFHFGANLVQLGAQRSTLGVGRLNVVGDGVKECPDFLLVPAVTLSRESRYANRLRGYRGRSEIVICCTHSISPVP